ncbi:hypothetical protein [Paenibacillus pini]|uniref:LysM domain-containing protein n=1 Tax=Paenibacillus pini JCM 16418 TaxID=1236976 RepID=W7YQ14_9BACL|nr:hypothetical protein [Paenibacillus pini]GAF06651.1 hypothetical protein JCM16418_623 [Paenibacillus pini JCM 16418]
MNKNIRSFLVKTTLACTLCSGLSIPAVHAEASEWNETDPVTITTPENNNAPSPERHGHHGRKHALLNDTASLLDLSMPDLIQELKKGKTLQQIAKEKKGWSSEVFVQKLNDVQTRKIDDAVKNGKMTTLQADQLKKRLPESLKRFVQHTHKPHSQRQPGTYSHI